MTPQKLPPIRVAILACDGFEKAELVEPRKALDDAGAETKVVSLKPGLIHGMHGEKRAGSVVVDMTLDEANPDGFDASLLPGGALNADTLRVEPKAKEFVRSMDREEKPVAMICHAPWLLV